MKKISCHICEYENEIASEQSRYCAVCEADLANVEDEKRLLICDSNALYSTVEKSLSAGWDAEIFLTTKRLIICPLKWQGFGLEAWLSASIYNKMTSNSALISIPLTDIKAVRDCKMGLIMKGIIIDTMDGGLVRIKVSKRNEWKEVIAREIE